MARRRPSTFGCGMLVAALVLTVTATPSRGSATQVTSNASASTCVRDAAADGRLVTGLYADLLGRLPSGAEVGGWTGSLLPPTSSTYVELVGGFTSSLEYRQREVVALYSRLLHRTPAASAFASRAAALATGTTTELAVSLASSDEYFTRAGATSSGFVSAVYADVLGRPPDPTRLASWVAQLASGKLSRAGLVSTFWQTAEHRGQRVADLYHLLLGRDPSTTANATRVAQLATHDDPWLAGQLAASPEYWSRAQIRFGGSASAQPAPCPKPCSVASAVAAWPLRERLAQLLTIGVASTGDAGPVLALASGSAVGGVIINGGGVSVYADSRLGTARTPRGVPLFVGTDEEGGRVDRLAALLGPIPSARTMAATRTPSQVRALARAEGMGMKAHGLNVDFAPDADVSDQALGDVIGDRSFSNDPAAVTAYAGAFALGLRDAGVLPVLKHFPGHGHAVGNSEVEPAVDPPLATLEADDLLPYTTLFTSTGPTAVLVGHLTVPGLTQPGVPASVSPSAINGLLRTTYGFKGVVFTDSLQMGAVSLFMNPATAVRHAIDAGADEAMLVNPVDVAALLDHLQRDVASGAIPQATVDGAVATVLAAKHFNPC